MNSEGHYDINDRVVFKESPADLNKSVGLKGTITEILPTVTNFITGEVSFSYGVKLDVGPNGQQAYNLAASEGHIEIDNF